MKVDCRHHYNLPLSIQPRNSKNKDVLPQNHKAIITPKKIHNHSISYGITSLHLNFPQLSPKCLLQLRFVSQTLTKFKHCISYNRNSLPRPPSVQDLLFGSPRLSTVK